MTDLPPLEPLFDGTTGRTLSLPRRLGDLYGELRLPERAGRPLVLANFVETLDGVTTLAAGKTGGGPISGANMHDRAVMGIVRAVSDAVIVGAGTLRSVPKHLWTPDYIYPDFAPEYAELRRGLGKQPTPLNVIVTASGDLVGEYRVLDSNDAPVLVVTSEEGALTLARRSLGAGVKVVAAGSRGMLDASAVLQAVVRETPADTILTEGGPRLFADFLAEGLVDELLLTLAPQIAGRDDESERPGLVAGRSFAPDNAIWTRLASVKRGGSHLFLRYSLGG